MTSRKNYNVCNDSNYSYAPAWFCLEENVTPQQGGDYSVTVVVGRLRNEKSHFTYYYIA